MNKKSMLKIITLCVVVAGIIFAYLLHGGGGGLLFVSKTVLPTVAGRELGDTEFKEEKDGKLVWLLKIKSSQKDQKRNLDIIKGIYGKMVREDGSIVTLTAEAGEFDERAGKVRLTVKPKAVLSTGGEATGKTFTWLNKEEIIIVEGDAKIVKDDCIATAQKVIWRTKVEKITLLGKAKVRKGVEVK